VNLRSYYPDFVAVEEGGGHWRLETKGQETADAPRKDAAAEQRCENATAPAGTPWRYAKIPQKDFEALRPSCLAGSGRRRSGAELGQGARNALRHGPGAAIMEAEQPA
jgi:hypothetical protein